MCSRNFTSNLCSDLFPDSGLYYTHTTKLGDMVFQFVLCWGHLFCPVIIYWMCSLLCLLSIFFDHSSSELYTFISYVSLFIYMFWLMYFESSQLYIFSFWLFPFWSSSYYSMMCPRFSVIYLNTSSWLQWYPLFFQWLQ